MNRKEFDFLEIKEQLDFINNGLANGESVNTMTTDIGIDRKSIRMRFRKVGYEYDEIQKKYINNTNVVDSNTDVVKLEDKPKLPKNTSVVPNVTSVVQTQQKSTTPVFCSTTDKNKSDKIDIMLRWFENRKNETNDISLDMESFTGGVKVTSVRMYKDVEESFKEFCKEFPQFKTMDIMSQALIEFMGKYKNK